MNELISHRRYNNISSLTAEKKLDQYDFANLFTVVELAEKSYFNISRTIRFDNIDNMPENIYYDYEITLGDTWTNLSFKFYNTYKLWWLICKFNNIINPFSELIPGRRIKIPNEIIVENILSEINK